MATESPFTVVLLYPDYCTGDYGADTYITAVTAADDVGAGLAAMEEAAEANDGNIAPGDFRVVAIFEGDCNLAMGTPEFESEWSRRLAAREQARCQ